jgi:signal transduction histidine kinase
VTRRADPDPATLAAFLASLAHDLRSPLGIVSLALGELRADFKAGLTDEHRMLAGLADRGLQRLGRIADSLSLVAALDSGRFELHCQPLDLVDLVRAATATGILLEPRQQVEVICELPEGRCRSVADPARLTHVLSELVINAIRHAYRRVRVRLEIASGGLRLAIEDDGKGPSDKTRATLFQRFAGARARGGLGIGLSSASDVIAAHGGSLTLEASTLGPGRPNTVGARFLAILPVAAAPVDAGQALPC